MLVPPGGDCEKNEGDRNGDSVLSGSGSSTDETFEQEEFLDELSPKMAEHMLQEQDQRKVANKHKAARGQHRYGEVKENKYGATKAGFRGGAPPNGSGLRVLYLGSRNGSGGGTGVFIPHAANPQPDDQPRKKPAGRCARVLIPERVVHCLKQHHEKRNGGPIGMFEAHENEMRLETVVVNNNDEEVQLPPEWTY